MSDILLSALVTSSVALFSFLVKFYFEKIHSTMDALKCEINQLRGHLEGLSRDIRENTVEGAGLRSEVKAIWRFVDAHKRSSDV